MSELFSRSNFQTIIEKLTDEDLDLFIDFRPYMCEAPYSVPEVSYPSFVFLYLCDGLDRRNLGDTIRCKMRFSLSTVDLATVDIKYRSANSLE